MDNYVLVSFKLKYTTIQRQIMKFVGLTKYKNIEIKNFFCDFIETKLYFCVVCKTQNKCQLCKFTYDKVEKRSSDKKFA